MTNGTRICTYPACERERRYREFCQTHYKRQRKGYPMDAPSPQPRVGQCSAEGCDRSIWAAGKCSTHYNRARDGRQVDAPVREYLFHSRGTTSPDEVPRCSVESCGRPAKTKGMCGTHYRAEYRRTWVSAQICIVDDCGQPIESLGMCGFHYGRSRRGVPLDRPRQIHRPQRKWCGVMTCMAEVESDGICPEHRAMGISGPGLRRRSTHYGYMWVHVGKRPGANKAGYVMEHRFVMEQVIGRTLETHENVHHKNGCRWDNRPENLELWVVSQPKGQRACDLVDWAREIISKYEGLPDGASGRAA